MWRIALAMLCLGTAQGLSLKSLRAKAAAAKHSNAEVVKQGAKVCVGDHLAPTLFVIGAQKAATTTMANDWKEVIDRPLYSSWSPSKLCKANEDDICKKETQYFNLQYKAQNRSRYANLYTTCKDTVHGVAADFTPDYLPNQKVPERIAEFYADKKDSLVFVVSLREPIRRMQSAFYDGVNEGWCCKETSKDGKKYTPSFKEHTDHLLTAVKDFAGEEGNFYAQLGNAFQGNGGAKSQQLFRRHRTAFQGLYYYNLLPWLKQFDAKQFVVFPGKEYTANREDFSQNPVINAINDRLHDSLQIHPTASESESGETKNRNVGKHPKLAEDLSEEDMKVLEKKVFHPVNVKLAKLLAKKQKDGLTLAGYEGDEGDYKAILKWLEKGWTF